MTVVEAGTQRLVFDRAFGGERLRCSFNLSEAKAPYRPEGRQLLKSGEIGSDLGSYAGVIEVLS